MHNNEDESKATRNIEQVIAEDGRYSMDAFGFLHESLGQSVKKVYGDSESGGSGSSGEGGSSHVTGRQLCDSLRDAARERWGLMAPAVLRQWGIHGSIDFGHMVYLLIEHGFMRKTEDDSVEDFRDMFDLDRDFDTSDEIRLKE
ncbi:MAG: hypothetical protein K8S55_12740 [Phycisphaerae bacterium]|nr:hypothetical protein [Phycisphaerae bacterium]